MINLNTNLSALIIQRNLRTSTNKLNQAIERLSTGAKLNHASDNAANWAISTNIDTKLNAYEVAEDNVSQGMSLVDTASFSLEIIEDRLTRLRILQETAKKGTYGDESLNAINAECNALVDEIERVYSSTEYNAQSLLLSRERVDEYVVDETTKFKALGITNKSFTVYDSSGSAIQSYDVEEEDTISDFFDVLHTHNFTTSIRNGKITLVSPDEYYIDGDLAQTLGISINEVQKITDSTQISTNPVSYTITTDATGNTTFSQLGMSDGVVKVMNADNTEKASINVTGSMSINDLFEELSHQNITGLINNGIISLSSPAGNYLASGTITNALGISTNVTSNTTIGSTQISTLLVQYTSIQTTPGGTETIPTEVTTTIWTTTTTSTTRTITSGVTQTSTAPVTYTTTTNVVATLDSLVSDFIELDSTYDFHNSFYIFSPTEQAVCTVTSTTTFGGLIAKMTSCGVSATMEDGVIKFSGTNGAYVVNHLATDGPLEKLGITTRVSGTTTTTVATIASSGVTPPTLAQGNFIQAITSVSTTGLTDLADVSTDTQLAVGTYKISTTAGLQ